MQLIYYTEVKFDRKYRNLILKFCTVWKLGGIKHKCCYFELCIYQRIMKNASLFLHNIIMHNIISEKSLKTGVLAVDNSALPSQEYITFENIFK